MRTRSAERTPPADKSREGVDGEPTCTCNCNCRAQKHKDWKGTDRQGTGAFTTFLRLLPSRRVDRIRQQPLRALGPGRTDEAVVMDPLPLGLFSNVSTADRISETPPSPPCTGQRV
mmetsp:Transcript_54186/g.89391  ORF Transcript_54186/g.89391 Transcript_54186/m.89391 type:complete len:116 (-) Transcript_54186:40-387(-)